VSPHRVPDAGRTGRCSTVGDCHRPLGSDPGTQAGGTSVTDSGQDAAALADPQIQDSTESDESPTATE